MTRVVIPWPTTSAKGEPARAGVGRMVNALLEQLPDGTIMCKRAPGVRAYAESAGGNAHCRGLIAADTATALAIYDNSAEAISIGGDARALGQVDGSRLVTLARNNKAPLPDIVCATETGVYTLTTDGAPQPYADPNIGQPNSVCFGDGYFFFTYGDGEVQASALNDTALNPLDKMIFNSSHGLMRGVFHAQTLFLFSATTIEAWTDTANAEGFPFSRAAVIPRGLLAPMAVAGHEANFTSALIWVGADGVVYLMDGYAPRRISTQDIEARIDRLVNRAALRACVYMSGGHAIWQMTSDEWTLCYDATVSAWVERDSDRQAFSRIERSVYAFGEWLVGDHATGKIGAIDLDEATEYGEPLTWSVTSYPVSAFPEQRVCARVDFDLIVGGQRRAPSGAYYDDPQIKVSWSDDGGAQFRQPLQRALGGIGETRRVVTVLRCGQASCYGRVWRLEASDPVGVALLGGSMTHG